MATSTDIPPKYLYAMVYFAAMLIAEQEEQYDTKKYLEQEAYKRLAYANSVEDYLPNSKRVARRGYFG